MNSSLALESRKVAGLPLLNSILDRLGVDALLHQALPAGGRLDAGQALGVLVGNIALHDRQPVYTHVEWARQAEPALVGLKPGQADLLNDDRVGRALAGSSMPTARPS